VTAQAAIKPQTIPPDHRVWWFRIIIDLCNSGYTHQTIAVAVGVSKSSIQNWKTGATPGYDEGSRLIQLWCQVTANGQETVPTISRYSHLA